MLRYDARCFYVPYTRQVRREKINMVQEDSLCCGDGIAVQKRRERSGERERREKREQDG